jgi:short-subunit dehydrogenase
MSSFRPAALITGASSGIGAALARLFAAAGHEVVAVARNEEALNALADGIGALGHTRPHVLALDLGRLDAGARIGHELAARGLEPAYVVNNAGFGLVGPAEELDRAEQLAMIDLNVRALTELSLRWTEALSRQRGGILNVASIAGFLPGANMAVYYATKAYVVSFTESLHRELAPKGVRVTALCPGPVPTGFQTRAGFNPRRLIGAIQQSPEAVARAGYDGLMAGKRLVVPGLAMKAATLLPRLLPRGWMLAAADMRNFRKRSPRPRWPKP